MELPLCRSPLALISPAQLAQLPRFRLSNPVPRATTNLRHMSSQHHSKQRPSGVGRRCTRSGCSEIAVRTLTYIYSDSTAVLGPLSTFAEPHAFDLCQIHSERLRVPQGWTSIIHDGKGSGSHEPSPEDLMAIADAVREVANMETEITPVAPDVGRRGHLRVIPSNNSDKT